MEEALEMARGKDTKSRMAGVERLHETLEKSSRPLTSSETASLVDCCLDLLKDGNFRVAQGGLQALSAAAVLAGEHFKIHLNSLVPATVDRLGDGKQPVRDAARQLLVTLMEVSSPTIIVERAGSFAWTNKSWRVREEFVRTVAAAVGLFASTELPLLRALLPNVLHLLNDPNQSVRDAAMSCIEEIYKQMGPQFHEELQRHNLPSFMLKEINARVEKVEPKPRHSDGPGIPYVPSEVKSYNSNPKKSSPRNKSTPRESSLFAGDGDITEKPVDPIKVYSEKELIREFEKIASTLVPEKDWSLRIAAMQRVEALVYGGAMDYPSFLALLKQLVQPLCTQLSDRRSSIVKQACHLLNMLSKELLGDFEACAEIFIPVLFKLVVITVLVIAESADNCIKTILRNCKVARALPKIADTAKNDRSAVLRARCCEYALLVLEYWADAPEIQRSADIYEDLIKCCVADAMSEVRSTARTCYRMFSKTWPERSRRLFMSFDPSIQRLINDEDGGMHKRYASPALRDRGGSMPLSRTSNTPSGPILPGYGTSAIVAMDKTASTISSEPSLSSTSLLSQSKSNKTTERSLESVLSSSKQKVSAIESLLKGAADRNFSVVRSSSLDLGVDAPSSRDPPALTSGSNHLSLHNSLVDSTLPTVSKAGNSNTFRNGGSYPLENMAPQMQTSRSNPRSAYYGTHLSDSSSHSYTKRQTERHIDMDRHYLDSMTSYRDSHSGSYVPNFQRPLRKQSTQRATSVSRYMFDDGQVSPSEMTDNSPASLTDALGEGLSPSSDWVARVSAFNYIRGLIQQGPRGLQEITQNFEKVMKLFFRYLDDPHHKVAQAALSTLAEIIPACKKPFESYIERILPHVFSRLIDPKELVRQPCVTTLETVGKTYNTDTMLPALLRSLDEQRSPKAKLAVIEFANKSFNKHVVDPEGTYSNGGFLKLWLAKLAPLVNDKNSKLKEASISGIIAVYSHFDSVAVLNFILSLSIEEQNSLRRALKQYTPRIEVDLVNFLQSKKERQRPKSYDQTDLNFGNSSEEGFAFSSKKGYQFGRYSGSSLDAVESARKSSSMQEPTHLSLDGVDAVRTWASNDLGKPERNIDIESSISTPRLDLSRLVLSDVQTGTGHVRVGEVAQEASALSEKFDNVKNSPLVDNGPSIPQLLHRISIANEASSSLEKREALQQLVKVSTDNDTSIWTKYFNQILTAVLEVLDDSEASMREHALSLILEMLNNQKSAMEDSIEIVFEKLIHGTKDIVSKVSDEAHKCLNILLTQYDPFRCLGVVVPLLVSEDEKSLVVCINCLTKIVGRLSQEEVMTQLPTFLPALFDAFGNQSPDVRKTVVFCLVDIYIMLGKAFLPYLEGLSSTQLRLVTIYANRISQARSGAPADSSN
ncbi:CLIP-associating protein [Rhynchospora pubera]|uniref:CLIP-associating protein n=1 Tax=Rhynchospora pubera TaxID=906938 RepID=A0AAV8BVB1_9POAL|nr:CLIP-associating protein [Rhynchospora pubera]